MKVSNVSILLLAGSQTLGIAFAQPPSPPETRALAAQAYTFAYPLVLMEFTRRGTPQPNRFANAQAFPDDTFRQVIRPNADTLYSSSWLDLSKEPILLHVPDTHDRFYLMQFMDGWTETFSVPGKRTTGTEEGWFAIVGPGWHGTLPARAKRIDAPTNMVWLLGRTQTNSATDYDYVHSIQKGFLLMPLSQYPDGPREGSAPTRLVGRGNVAPPPVQVAHLGVNEFFQTFAALLEKNPPHPEDAPLMRDLARVGLEPGKSFNLDALPSEQRKAFEEGATSAAKALANPPESNIGRGTRNGWSEIGR